jgi:hypothetical protein
MHRRAVTLARPRKAGPLQDAANPADGTPGTLGLGTQDVLG